MLDVSVAGYQDHPAMWAVGAAIPGAVFEEQQPWVQG